MQRRDYGTYVLLRKVFIYGIARNHVDCCCLFFVAIVHLLTCNFISTLTARLNMDDAIPVASHTRVPACSEKLRKWQKCIMKMFLGYSVYCNWKYSSTHFNLVCLFVSRKKICKKNIQIA